MSITHYYHCSLKAQKHARVRWRVDTGFLGGPGNVQAGAQCPVPLRKVQGN